MIYENLPNAPATLPRREGGGRHPQGGLAWLARHRAQETTAQRPNAKGPEKLFVQRRADTDVGLPGAALPPRRGRRDRQANPERDTHAEEIVSQRCSSGAESGKWTTQNCRSPRCTIRLHNALERVRVEKQAI